MSPCSCKNRRTGQQVALWQTGEGVRITAHNRDTAEIVVLCCCRLDLYLPASIMLQTSVNAGKTALVRCPIWRM